MMSRTTGSLIAAVMFAAVAGSAQAYVCIHAPSGQCVHWAQSGAIVKSFLGSPGGTLINGTVSWDQNSINAANDWNAVGTAFRFTVEVGGNFYSPCGPAGPNHVCYNTGPIGDNPVFFASNFCGQSFGDAIELTNNCYNPDTGELYNAPVFVNNGVLWNAYDGPIRSGGGRWIYDIRRVLLHEFGHVLGLGHPDLSGQTVDAIMNSSFSATDRLTDDDLSGIRSLYAVGPGPNTTNGANGCAISAPPKRNGYWLLAPLALLGWRRRRAHIQ